MKPSLVQCLVFSCLWLSHGCLTRFFTRSVKVLIRRVNYEYLSGYPVRGPRGKKSTVSRHQFLNGVPNIKSFTDLSLNWILTENHIRYKRKKGRFKGQSLNISLKLIGITNDGLYTHWERVRPGVRRIDTLPILQDPRLREQSITILFWPVVDSFTIVSSQFVRLLLIPQ